MILSNKIQFKYLNKHAMNVMLRAGNIQHLLGWRNGKQAVKRWVKSALGRSDSDWSRVLTCFPSASGWWSSHVYRHRRCPLLYTRGPSPPPRLPGWCPQCWCHLEKKQTQHEIITLRDVLLSHAKKEENLRTNFHHLRSTFRDASLIFGSAVIFSRVLLPDRTEFLNNREMTTVFSWH